MGANSSVHHGNPRKYGEITFTHEKDIYYPGDTLNGVIHLNLLSSYPADSLYVQVKGCEKYMYAYHETKTELQGNREVTVQEEILERRKSLFMISKISILSIGAELQPGQYSMPMSFTFPSNIPTSFYQKGEASVASVEFKLVVFLESPQLKAPTLKKKEPLLLSGQKKPQFSKPIQKQKHFRLTSWCFWKHGGTNLSVELESGVLVAGEKFKLKLRVDNSQSKVGFSRVICKLIQKMSLDRGLTLRKAEYCFNEIELPGFEADEEIQEQKIEIVLPWYNPADRLKKIPYDRYRFDDVHRMKYSPEQYLAPSISGKIIDVQYYLKIELNQGSKWCFQNPVVNIPVQVCLPSLPKEPMIQLPARELTINRLQPNKVRLEDPLVRLRLALGKNKIYQ